MKISERDSKLIEYAKVSGAFYFAAQKFMANKTLENFREVQSGINNLLNRAYPDLEAYCKEHAGDVGIDSLLEIAKTDRDSMGQFFANLRLKE